ncbi:hypothetical protein QJS04_geneDACA024847 [Acorus gramineus]|uniref:Uncharacterized protein n=1 Tax=Acorus gramineus TaxID=55184 RepID=A0AAV9A0F4_ACOGR|nr:hypothetical protein QJS04_geneDACA024847 [Acorus gramineus]
MTESSESVYAVESTQDNHKESTNGPRKVVPPRRRNHPKVVKEEGLMPIPIGQKPFRFERFWFEYPELLNLVTQAWNTPEHASPLGRNHHKLSTLCETLQQWNKSETGDLPTRIREAHQQLDYLTRTEQQQNIVVTMQNNMRPKLRD